MARIIYARFDAWLVSLDPAKGSEIKKNKAMCHYFSKRNK